ncbi:hypothetical protein F5X98DRAFT_391204 [Xylaria grammica]|nr:hypothetical protein F5X98DRAFT_391204 [Xylaria grammica]
MDVKCSDVPRLMREGFHWDDSNVIKEEGYLQYGKTNADANSWDLLSTIWYFLADIDQPRRWIACLAVKALNDNTLYNFNLSQLSRETIRSVSASNQDRQHIYGYISFTPADKLSNTAESAMLGFNMIYDKMPMEGFWPWPRERNEAYVKDGADEVADEKLVSVSTQTYSFEDSVRWKRNLIDFEEDPNKGK